MCVCIDVCVCACVCVCVCAFTRAQPHLYERPASRGCARAKPAIESGGGKFARARTPTSKRIRSVPFERYVPGGAPRGATRPQGHVAPRACYEFGGKASKFGAAP